MATTPPVISALPAAPDPADRSTFNIRAYPWSAALPGFATSVSAVADNVYANAVISEIQAANAEQSAIDSALSAGSAATYGNSTASSTSSVLIGLGSKTFTVPSGKSWVAGMPLTAWASATQQMYCTVTSYASTTLVVNCTGFIGAGTLASWGLSCPTLLRLPIFSAAAATRYPVSAGEPIVNHSPNMLGQSEIVIYGNGLFAACAATTAGTNISTSPDGITWTLRAMPSSAKWRIATNGSNQWIATADAASTVAKSTDGITWSAGTALPAVTVTGYGVPVFNGSLCLVLPANGTTNAYTSSNNAATWGTQTLPNTSLQLAYAVGGLFWVTGGGTTFTSATGVTGTWTSRTLPAGLSSNSIIQDFDGSLLAMFIGFTSPHRSTDGINWTLTTLPSLMMTINGVAVSVGSGTTGSQTIHNEQQISRKATSALVQLDSTRRFAKSSDGLVYVFGSTGGTGARIAPNESTASMAFFQG